MADPARILALVDRQAAARQGVVDRLVAGLLRLLRALTTDDRYDDRAVELYAARAAALSRTAQATASGATGAYLRAVLAELGAEPGRVRVQTPAAIRGVDPVEVYTRPVRDFRRLRVDGLDELAAADRAESRLALLGETDVALAVRDTSRQVLAAADRVTGWRRVIHPELSRGGSCGLCVAAADRRYSRGDLLPLHARCNCEVLPIVDGRADPGLQLNADSLRALYAAAGSTAAGDLARTRWTVREHGELGPTLVAADAAFRGPADVADTAAA